MTIAAFTSIPPEKLKENAISIIGIGWMLITAGTAQSFNTMTASWGGLGVLWGMPVAFCFIRPQRHTYSFMEKADHFTLSFFDEKYRSALAYCGEHSGKDVDKVKETGLTPAAGENCTIYFNEARMVLECRKIYFQDIMPEHFLDPSIAQNYPSKDYHRMYVGAITAAREAAR